MRLWQCKMTMECPFGILYRNNVKKPACAPSAERGCVLVVDDDSILLKKLKTALSNQGFLCFTAETGEQMDAVMSSREIDAIVLDIGLPDTSGLTQLEKLRKSSEIPVLIYSGHAEVEDTLNGLGSGADDYITKPCDSREICARIEAVLRRKGRNARHKEDFMPATIGGWLLNPSTRGLSNGRGDEIIFSAKEFDLLIAFARNAGKTLTRHWLLYAVHQRPWNPEDRAIDVLVGRLRKKLLSGSWKEAPLVSEHSHGYRFTLPVTYDSR